MNVRMYKKLTAGMLSLILAFSGVPLSVYAQEPADVLDADSVEQVETIDDQADLEFVAYEDEAVPEAVEIEEEADAVFAEDLEEEDGLDTLVVTQAEKLRAGLAQDANEFKRAEAVWTMLFDAAKKTLLASDAQSSLDVEAETICALRGEVSTSRGLSHAFALIARELGLDALEVGTGTGNAWNMVRIDGVWYHVDLMFAAAAKDAAEGTHPGLLLSDTTMATLIDEGAAWNVIGDAEAQVPTAANDWVWASATDAEEEPIDEQFDEPVVSDFEDVTVPEDEATEVDEQAQEPVAETDENAEDPIAVEGQNENTNPVDENVPMEEPLPVELPSDEELEVEALAYETANTYVAETRAVNDPDAHVVSVPFIQSGAPLEEVVAMAHEAAAMDNEVMPLATENMSGAKTAVGNGIANYATSIDISAYNIPTSKVMTLMWEVVNSHPELFYITTQVGYRTSGSKVTTINPAYLYSQSTANSMKAKFERELDIMVSWASKCTTAQDKAKAIHDYLCRYTSYYYEAASSSYNPDTAAMGHKPWTAYGCLVEHKCVCQGYTLALRCGLNRLGISGDYAMTSGHIWNTVKVGSDWYNVDVTSDDPGGDHNKTPYSTFYLKSKTWFSYFQSNWTSNYACTKTNFDSATWQAYPLSAASTTSISNAAVTGIANKVYTGKALTQAPTVKLGTKTLVNGTNYTISYTNNTNVGTATIKITGKGSYTGSLSKTFAILPATPTTTVSNVTAGITVKWTKAAGATGYYVYRKAGSGGYSKVRTVTTAAAGSWTDSGVKANNGTTYTYYVVAYGGTAKLTGGKKTAAIARLATPATPAAANLSGRKAKFAWKKNASATGYQVQWSLSSTFASGNKSATITKNTTLTYTTAALTKGKTYYGRVRAYKKVGTTTYYSAWSAKKAIKITK